MKKVKQSLENIMNKKNFLFFLVSVVYVTSHLTAFDDTPSCYKLLETNFFEPKLVSQALSLQAGYQQYQSTWPLINDELRRRSLNVSSIIKNKANRMNPSPLEYPFQYEAAANLLWTTLYEIFSSVVQKYGINDQGDISTMFNYLRTQQEVRLKNCLQGNE